MNPADPLKKQRLVDRLDGIKLSLESSGHALALIGLGSAGQAMDRLDTYSDLDFFVIVEDGYKNLFRDNLEWLSEICPLAYHFQNSVDGHKVLFEDGVFIEFAVFTPADLTNIPFTGARLIWAAGPDFASELPEENKVPVNPDQEIGWFIDEALTNIYVGLCRYRRGEKLNAFRFIQGHAMDRIIELSDFLAKEERPGRDQFSKTRRYEQRFPEMAKELPALIQGYDHSVESALAILSFLEQRFVINEAMRDAILALARQDNESTLPGRNLESDGTRPEQ